MTKVRLGLGRGRAIQDTGHMGNARQLVNRRGSLFAILFLRMKGRPLTQRDRSRGAPQGQWVVGLTMSARA